jgi:hypothetical protein
MSLFSFKQKKSVSLVFDIRDSSITAAAVIFEKEKKPTLLLSESTIIAIDDPYDHERYAGAMLASLDNAILSIRKNLARTGNNEPIKKYFFFLGSPWSIAESKILKIIKDKAFEMTKDILGKTISSEEMRVQASLDADTQDANWRLLEEKIVQFKLNGYPVTKVFNKKINELEIELFVSFIPENIEHKLSEAINKSSQKVQRQLNSSVLSAYSFFRDLYPERSNFIFIDIGRYISEVFIVKDDILEGIASFPFGEQKLLEPVMRKFNIPENMAMSYITMGCQGACDTRTEKMIQSLTKTAIKIWLDKLHSSITKIVPGIDLPKDMFIVETSDMTKFLTHEIKNGELSIFKRAVHINQITEGIANNFIENGKAFRNIPHLKIDLAFLQRTAIQ